MQIREFVFQGSIWMQRMWKKRERKKGKEGRERKSRPCNCVSGWSQERVFIGPWQKPRQQQVEDLVVAQLLLPLTDGKHLGKPQSHSRPQLASLWTKPDLTLLWLRAWLIQKCYTWGRTQTSFRQHHGAATAQVGMWCSRKNVTWNTIHLNRLSLAFISNFLLLCALQGSTLWLKWLGPYHYMEELNWVGGLECHRHLDNELMDGRFLSFK